MKSISLVASKIPTRGRRLQRLHVTNPSRQVQQFSSYHLSRNCGKAAFPSVPGTIKRELTAHNRSTNILRYFSTSQQLKQQRGCAEFLGYDLSHPDCNVPPNIADRVGTNLHLQPKHPLNTIKNIIEAFWHKRSSSLDFVVESDLHPVVTTEHNFDALLIPPDHVSRSKSDTYYLDKVTVLRTHTSAHQTTLLKSGINRFLVTGDVYRRDEIDSSHYPIFHQMEGVKMFTETEFSEAGATTPTEKISVVEQDLKSGLEDLARELFGDVKMRWVDAYFPFTDPSYELEIFFNGEWLEVLGCGVVHRDITKAVGRDDQVGWAFGLGLERLAMVLFSIPDIRLFWSKDERFHSQFASGEIVTFQSYSKYPPCLKDISFWTSSAEGAGDSKFHPNDLNEVVRDVAGDLVERVELIDEFVHPKTKRTSNCFRISFRSMDRSLTNEEIDLLQKQVREETVSRLGVELR